MAAQMISVVSRILFLFLLINYNYAEETKEEPNITSKDKNGEFQDNADNSGHPWNENVESEGETHIRQSRELKNIKSLRIKLDWYNKVSDDLVGSELSKDFRNDGTIIEQLGLSIVNNVNNGGYDVQPGWVGILQSHFNHRINFGVYDYQISFEYREWWEDMRVINFELFHSPSWRKQGSNIYINLTPDISGEIVRATFTYIGHDDPSTMMRIHLLGTSFDCRYNQVNKEFEFFPTQRQLVSGQAFEVTHTTHATQTRHNRYSIGKPLQVRLTFTVQVKH